MRRHSVDNIIKLKHLTFSLIEKDGPFEEKNKELSIANLFLSNVLDTIPSFVFVKDRESRFVYVNERVCELYGMRREDIVGKFDYEIGLDTDFYKVHYNDLEVIDYKIEKINPKMEIYDKLGKTRYFKIIKKPLIESDGTCNYLMGICEEITDLVEAQFSLQESNYRFELASKASDQGLWDWMDVRYEKEWWSAKYYEILGYEEDEFAPTFDFWKNNLVHPDDLPFLEKKLKSCFSNPEEKWDVQYRMKLKSGEYRWFKTIGDIQRSVTGQPIRMIGFTHDINNLVISNDKVEKDRKKYYFILEAVLDALIVADKKGIIVFVNSHFLKLTNHSMNTLLGAHINCLIEDSFVKEHDKYISDYLSGASVRDIMGKTGRHVKIKTYDGLYKDINLAVTDVVVDGERLFIATASELKKEENDN